MRLHYLLLALALFSSLSYADSWKFDAWNYRYKLVITEPGVIDRTDWPVDVPVYFTQGRVADCTKEIRVTNSDGAEVPVYVYNKQATNTSCSSANVVFKVPVLTKSSSATYYLYYGNPKAADPAYSSFDPYYSLKYTDASFVNFSNATNIFTGADDCEAADSACPSSLVLPWPFSFYGTTYTSSPRIGSNGVFSFLGMGQYAYITLSEGEFRKKEVIALLWDDLITSAYYENFQNPQRIVFTWNGVYSAVPGDFASFQLTLYKTGDIRVSYGNITTLHNSSIAGISKGDSSHFIHPTIYPNGQSAFFQYSKAALSSVGSEEQHFPPVFSNLTISKSLVKYGESVDASITIDEDKGIQSPNGVDVVRAYVKTPKDTVILPVKKSSGTLLHGVYSANFLFNISQPAGVYDFYFWACDVDGLCATSDHKNVELNPSLKITIKTASPSYNQTDTINISGEVRDYVNRVANNLPLSLTLSSGAFRSSLSAKTDDLGVFSAAYKISTTDPEGNWSISANASDSLGNSGSAVSYVSVSEPRKRHYYNVMVLSPVDNSMYRRGEEVKFSVQVTEGGAPVDHALVSAATPAKKIDFVEAGAGVYTASYRVSYDDPVGALTFPISAIKQSGEYLYSGAASVPISVESTKLRIEFEPLEKEYAVGEPVTFKVKVFYPDNTLSKSTVLNATLNGRPVVFEGDGGIYTYTYFANDSDLGGLKLSVAGADLSDNRDEAKVLVSVRKKTGKEAAQVVIDEYWYAPYLAVILFLFAVIALTWPHMRLKRLEQQLADLEASKKFMEDKYFIKREITKQEFDNSIKEIQKKLAETKERLSKAEGVKKGKEQPPETGKNV